MIKKLLYDPNANIDGPERLSLHRAVLQRKPLIRDVFLEFHKRVLELERRYFSDTAGRRIELGAGVCPIRDTDPEVLATDLVQTSHLDQVLDAQNIDLPKSSVRALFGQNCFHHFPQPRRFFAEAIRVLTPGGGIILIEPFFGPFASFLYRRLFASETFDKKAQDWETPMTGPMVGANQALSYIIFVRDRDKFTKEFPQLECVLIEPLDNYLRYLLSGGLNFRQIIPDALSGSIKRLEKILRPLLWQLVLHHVIVLRRLE